MAINWQAAANLPTPVSGAAGAWLSGLFHVVGGKNTVSGNPGNYHQVFDPTAGTWTTAAPLPINVHRGTMQAIGGKLYFTGGSLDSGNGGTSGRTDATYCYDPANNTWSSRASNGLAGTRYASCAIGSKLYIAGGHVSNEWDCTTNARVYDTTTDTWSSIALVPNAAVGAAAGCTDGT